MPLVALAFASVLGAGCGGDAPVALGDAGADAFDVDATTSDAAMPDAGVDAAMPDAGVDAAMPDAGLADAGTSPEAELRGIATTLGLDGDPIAGRPVPSVTDPLPRLGRLLFFSRSLSGDFEVACASCHHPELGGADGLSLSVGVAANEPRFLGPGRAVVPALDRDPRRDLGPNGLRNAPTTFNSALYDRALFHDGRVFVVDATTVAGGTGQAIHTADAPVGAADPSAGGSLLEAQVRDALVDPNGMLGFGRLAALGRDGARDELAARLRGEAIDSNQLAYNDWLAAFRDAFGQPAGTPAQLVTFDNVARAISAYEASETFVDHAWKRFLAGDDGALDAAQKRGARLFLAPIGQGGAGCVTCHRGDHFTDESFIDVAFPQLGRGTEVTRADFARQRVTGLYRDRYRFRTPSLLNVEVTAPYGHAGSFQDLDALLAYHTNAQAKWLTFDYGLTSLPQFALASTPYPWAVDRTFDTVLGSSFLAQQPGLGAGDRADLAAFLRALTDPCVLDPACTAPYVPTAADDPDGNLLVRLATLPASAPTPIPGGAGLVDAFGGDATPSTLGIDLRALVCPERPDAAPGTLGFVEDAVAFGIDHVHRVDASRYVSTLAFSSLILPAGVASGDLDGDCYADLAFTAGDGGGVRAYRNLEGQGFAPVASAPALPLESIASGVVIADLDGDRRADLLTTELGRYGYVRAFSGESELGYAPAWGLASGRSAFGVALGDVDADGRPEVLVGHWGDVVSTRTAPALIGRGAGSTWSSLDAAWGTRPSDLDLSFGFSPALLDLDADADVDALFVADFGRTKILRQQAGRFVDATDRGVVTDENGMGLALGDLDGDLDVDAFVTAIYDAAPPLGGSWGSSGNRLYRNLGGGAFADATAAAGVADGSWGWGACAADLDNDGDLDLVQSTGYGDVPPEVIAPSGPIPAPIVALTEAFHDVPPRLFENQGSGVFVERAAAYGLAAVRRSRGISCTDLDRDGDVDVVFATHEGAPAVMRNRVGADASHRFLAVSLVGAAPDTQALGATVLVTAGGRTQRRDVLLYSHFVSHDPLEQHVGLGAATVVDEVRVVWPDGAPDTVLTGIPTNRHLVVRHPSLSPLASAFVGDAARVAPASAAALVAVASSAMEADALPIVARLVRDTGVSVGFDPAAVADGFLASAISAGDAAAIHRYRLLVRAVGGTGALDASDVGSVLGSAQLVARALACRDVALPATFADDLRLAGAGPLDAATDALEALVLASELGCGAPLGRLDTAALVASVRAAVAFGDGTLDRADLRALALLSHVGREDLIDAATLRAVLDAAQPGGGYGAAQPLDGSVVPVDDVASVDAAWLLSSLSRHARVLTPLAP